MKSTSYPKRAKALAVFAGPPPTTGPVGKISIKTSPGDQAVDDFLHLGVVVAVVHAALVAAWLLTFTLSFDDVVISEFLSGPGVTTLPQVIFSYARRGVNPSIYAAATLLMAVVSLAVVFYGVHTARKMRREAYRPVD